MSGLRHWWPILRLGGVMIMDDYNPAGAMWLTVLSVINAFFAATVDRGFECPPYKYRVCKSVYRGFAWRDLPLPSLEPRGKAIQPGLGMERLCLLNYLERKLSTIVRIAAGIVALVAGVMWGARSNVSFALQIVSLKALPVLILGGFTSVPGVIVAGLVIGCTEKLGEFYWGPLVGSG